VLILRELALVAIDGAFFDGNASKVSIITRERLQARLAGLDAAIADVASEMAAAAQSETEAAQTEAPAADLVARREVAAADMARLEASGQTQLSQTDPDARLLTKWGQSVAGYNVQIAVDAEHKLIVAAAAVSDGNDVAQLHTMARAAREAMGAQRIEAFVPESRRGRSRDEDGRFGFDDFAYDADADIYRCPAGQKLAAMRGGRTDATGRFRIKYASRISTCEGMMRRRKALAERPFCTSKCRAGYRHFLVRGLPKVRGELGMMVLCYNLTRVVSIIGLEKLVAWLATHSFWPAIGTLWELLAAVGRILARLDRFRAESPPTSVPLPRHHATSRRHATTSAESPITISAQPRSVIRQRNSPRRGLCQSAACDGGWCFAYPPYAPRATDAPARTGARRDRAAPRRPYHPRPASPNR
jgi:hypothetical protein